MKANRLEALPHKPIPATRKLATGGVVGKLIVLGLMAGLVGAAAHFIPRLWWNGRTTYVCSGNMTETLSGREGRTTGIVVEAKDNCILMIRDSKLRGKVAIHASGNAVVTVTGGLIEGSTAALISQDLAMINVTDTEIDGHQRVHPVYGYKEQPLEKGRPYLCNSGNIRLADVKIDLKGRPAIVANGSCVLTIDGCEIRAEAGILATGNAEIKLRNCTIVAARGIVGRANAKIELDSDSEVRGEERAIDIGDNAKVDLRGAKVVGTKSKRGNAVFR